MLQGRLIYNKHKHRSEQFMRHVGDTKVSYFNLFYKIIRKGGCPENMC